MMLSNASLSDPVWMTSEACRRLMSILTEGGPSMRFIGGCVRDTLVGRCFGDIDIITTLRPFEVVERLDRAGIKCGKDGIAYGALRVQLGGQHFEITTLRRDVATFGRSARVEFTGDFRADIYRRDFTFNAIGWESLVGLIDEVGGVADLARGRVRFIGDPRRRLTEDILRLLRFWRFHAHYGWGCPDSEVVEVCGQMAARLELLSADRVRDELLKTLSGEQVLFSWRGLGDYAVIGLGSGGRWRLDRLERLVALERLVVTLPLGWGLGDCGLFDYSLGHDSRRSWLRLAALVDTPSNLEELSGKWRFSRAQRHLLKTLLNEVMSSGVLLSLGCLREVAGRVVDAGLFRRVVMASVARCDDLPLSDAEPILTAAWAVAEQLERTDRFPLTGDDLIAYDIVGPAIGDWLSRLRNWWARGGFVADRRACLAELERLTRTLNEK